jgi:hypothetical protein
MATCKFCCTASSHRAGRSLNAIPVAKNLPPVKDRSNFSNFITINKARFLDAVTKMVNGGVILKEILFT